MFVKCKKSVVVSKQNTIPRAEQRRFVENPSLTKTRKETRDLDSLGSYLNHPDAVEDKVRSNSRFRDGKNVARIGLASTTNLSEDVSHDFYNSIKSKLRERLAHIDRNEVRNLLQAWELEANWSASFDIEASNASEEGIFSTDHSLLGTYEEFFEDYDMDELGCMINPYFDSRPVSYSHTSDNLDERLFDFN